MWLVVFVSILAATQAPAPSETIVPKGTEIFLTMGRAISTATARPTDRFFATVAVPVVLAEKIVIPAGTHVTGEVELADEGGRLGGSAGLKLRWQSLILPSGQTLGIVAATDSADGQVRGDLKESGGKMKGSGKSEVAAESLDPDATIERIGRSATSPTGAAMSTGLTLGEGALVELFSRGPDAALQKGDMVTIELVQPIVLRAGAPAGRPYPERPDPPPPEAASC